MNPYPKGTSLYAWRELYLSIHKLYELVSEMFYRRITVILDRVVK